MRSLRLRAFRHAADLMLAARGTALGRHLRSRLVRSIHFARKGVAVQEPGFDGLSVVFLSDLHTGHVVGEDELDLVVERVNAEEPDLVCLGGDLVDTRPRDLRALEGPLSRLRARLGVFAVPGNHEYQVFSGLGPYHAFLAEHGVRLLLNAGVRLELGTSSIWLGGVDDLTEGRPDVEAALDGRRPGEPTLLLSHHPDVFPSAARRGVDLQLSGHTHGGQLRFFGWTPVTHTRRRYVSGAHWRGGSALYVSRGVGVTALPFRIGVPGEVPLFDLRHPTPAARARWLREEFELLGPLLAALVAEGTEATFLGTEEPEVREPARGEPVGSRDR